MQIATFYGFITEAVNASKQKTKANFLSCSLSQAFLKRRHWIYGVKDNFSIRQYFGHLKFPSPQIKPLIGNYLRKNLYKHQKPLSHLKYLQNRTSGRSGTTILVFFL